MILGFDPGRDKCGLAVMDIQQTLHHHAVVPASEVLATIQALQQQYGVTQIVMGDQTSAKQWQQRLQALPNLPPIALVDERYSSLEARDRYWEMYPAKGLTRLIPQGMRDLPRPIDDIVAILLIERYCRSTIASKSEPEL